MIQGQAQPPKRRADILVQRLAQYIREGVLKRGEKLPTEVDIASQEGFSRSVVREALLRLQAAGLVETRRSVGTFVIDMPPPQELRLGPESITTLEDVLHLLELRISLEVDAAGLAASNRSNADLADIRQALLAMKEPDSKKPGIAIQADFQFHLRIARASGNQYMFDIMKHLGTKMIPRTQMNSAYASNEERLAYLEMVHHEHDSIFAGIAMQSPDSARAAMFLHLNNSRERLRRTRMAKTTTLQSPPEA
ncbi:FadR family transcriptional regulator [Stutzerimonas zhaodongensis]|uniref:FadR family transcriptional regulator n=1 Tax=Stutzerimonas zhaodongensis TaxID=1176257 RepID=A0A3M2HDW6_9GAMM|nr:FadR/GntR family transcriptional regulator [Stutzerimonas zhaodongensis]MCQ2030196.1 FadR family transcriptional regulator [Stutzerimonas zhaodongensis]MCQ4318372.1 FadR family transcriptional regulator [Stutzerimonas zhaodongensis]RMH87946.1 FadR family transcriptional regulator [Stutzerimonas zhaodongensis]